MPTSTSPLLVCAVNAPLTARNRDRSRRRLRFHVAVQPPDRDPTAGGLELQIALELADCRIARGRRDDALPSTRCTATSPEAVSALMFPSRVSSATSPLADENRQSASRPSPCTSADADEACSRDLTGSAMSISTAPPRPSEMYFLPAATVSVPFLKSMRACSAARTSEAREGSRDGSRRRCRRGRSRRAGPTRRPPRRRP